MAEPAVDTIFALSTVPGRSGVAVVRLSGPGAGPAVERLTGCALPEARRATLARLADPATGAPIDQALVLWFPGPASFTGEDLAELHLHGGRAVRAAALEALAGLPGCRLAEPGEFARRAFDHGKLDLAEVEGLADLIDAETAAQRVQALRQMGGGLTRRVDIWRERLLAALAHLEAEIDFADEVLPAGLVAAAQEELRAARGEIAAALRDADRGERLRDGLQIAILGPPNAGKSSLLNALANRDVAIVSATAGTTRDVVELHLDLAGYPVTLADTAGLRALGADGDAAMAEIEAEGMRRSRMRAEGADLKLLVLDCGAWRMADAGVLALCDGRTLVVLNKLDLVADDARQGLAADVERSGLAELRAAAEQGRLHLLSARTGEGVSALLAAVARAAEETMGAGADGLVTRLRHRRALEDCAAALDRAGTARAAELAAEDLRLALRALGRITGRVDVEQVLDLIFREFCIGK
jgi:tRNA modification GTPase